KSPFFDRRLPVERFVRGVLARDRGAEREGAGEAVARGRARALGGNQPGHRLAVARDDDLCAGRHLVEQRREMGLGLEHADFFHRTILTIMWSDHAPCGKRAQAQLRSSSRAMITRMISFVPSRIWWTRRSRTMRSSGKSFRYP